MAAARSVAVLPGLLGTAKLRGTVSSSCGAESQSNELSRGPPELVQHFVYRESSYRRKSAACTKFDMVWL
jgi:hypothetical protein